MSLLEKLHPASFRSVSFLVSTESVRRGKKTVIHEYPNSDQRYVEELGKLPPTFSITAIIHGDDAIDQRLRLENALERPGLGLLVHPVYGNLNVKSLNFNVTSNQTDVGIFTFDIEFATSRENITPEPDAATDTTISSLAAAAKTTINDKLQILYKTPATPNIFDSAIEKTNGIFKGVHDTINTVVDKTTAGAAGFDRVYRSVTRNISTVVSSAQKLRDNATLLYDTALDVPLFVDQLAAAWNNLLDYPLTVPTSSAITADQAERYQNDNAIVEHMKLTSLANSYESSAYTDYATDVDLFAATERLNDVYVDFFKTKITEMQDVGIESIAGDQDVRAAFAELRATAKKVFDEKEKAIYRIVDVRPGMTSMALMAYRFYGDINLLDQLITLNESISAANFNETIKALTS